MQKPSAWLQKAAYACLVTKLITCAFLTAGSMHSAVCSVGANDRGRTETARTAAQLDRVKYFFDVF